jgi:DNA polymerase
MTTDALENLYRACAERFALTGAAGADQMVFGDGPAQEPALMLIGEAPGGQEALEGKPFVGKAGKNLTAFLETVGFHAVTFSLPTSSSSAPRGRARLGAPSTARPAAPRSRFSRPGCTARSRWLSPKCWRRWATWRWGLSCRARPSASGTAAS